ncbi:MAG: hypothetical protein K1X94_16470 [Sandaracinaceae bacterium]|jgi:hypothetical protein|nr:hypothetical protein [Sandaracinaceae bacterium]
MSTKNEFLFDKRILQRNIDKGLLEAKTADKTLSSLPDRADNVAITSYDDEPSADVGSDDEE